MILAAAGFMPPRAQAHSPTRQNVTQTVNIACVLRAGLGNIKAIAERAG